MSFPCEGGWGGWQGRGGHRRAGDPRSRAGHEGETCGAGGCAPSCCPRQHASSSRGVSFAFGGFGLKTLVQRSRHDTFVNTGWGSVEQSVPSLTWQGISQVKAFLLIHGSSVSNWANMCHASHKLIKGAKKHRSGREQLHKQGCCLLCDLGLVLCEQCSIIPFGKLCEQNSYLMPVKLSCYTSPVRLVNDFSDCNSF